MSQLKINSKVRKKLLKSKQHIHSWQDSYRDVARDLFYLSGEIIALEIDTGYLVNDDMSNVIYSMRLIGKETIIRNGYITMEINDVLW